MAQERDVQGKVSIPAKKRRREEQGQLQGQLQEQVEEKKSKGKGKSSCKPKGSKAKSAKPKCSKNSSSNKKPFFRRFFFKLFLWLLLIAIILVALLFLWQKISQIKVDKKYAVVSQELQRCSELTTVKITYSGLHQKISRCYNFLPCPSLLIFSE